MGLLGLADMQIYYRIIVICDDYNSLLMGFTGASSRREVNANLSASFKAKPGGEYLFEMRYIESER